VPARQVYSSDVYSMEAKMGASTDRATARRSRS
jgi:hypothetical protein